MRILTTSLAVITLSLVSFYGYSQAVVKPELSDGFYPVNSSEPLEPYYRLKADSILGADAPRHKSFKSDYGEMLTYIEGFRDEARRNGNINWDRGYVRSAKWIKWVLVNETDIFPDDINQEIKRDLKRIRKFRRPYTGHDVYDRLLRRVIEYFEAEKGYYYLE